ncbi:mannose-6-phosphate isomerase, class I [Naumannella halotolerans]|uniref:mannose-6-phosphate isomerase, class I n=1 Tax=Naumannella halotolerans TaxID=993414 RepID=UPI00370D3602
MYRLSGQVQHYAWGTTDAIAELLGTPATGEPQAEYWLGAHSSAPSKLSDGRGLDIAITEHPALLGESVRRRFGDRLPFLLKILSAAKALSLQAHPSRSQAEEGYRAEESAGLARDAVERNYRDDWPKPEAIIARTEFSGLCGFRSVAAAREALNLFNAPRELVTELSGAAPLEHAFLAALELTERQVRKVVDTAHTYAEAGGPAGRDARTVLQLARDFPDDPGIVAALMLNRVDLQPGEALFLGAGNMHAYLHGTGIEIMANSDNVLRGGLTPKHIDVAELSRVVDFSPEVPRVLHPVPEGPGISRYPTPAPEFAIWEVRDPVAASVPATDAPRILLSVAGDLRLTGTGQELTLETGQAVFLPAGEAVTVDGTGLGYLAGPGD